MNAPIGISFHPERFGVPAAIQLSSLAGFLSCASDGVRILPRQKNLLDASKWLQERGILRLEPLRGEDINRVSDDLVATLTDRGRALLELLWP